MTVAKTSRQMGESILLQRLLRGTQGENRNWEREKNHHQSILFCCVFFLHHDNSACSWKNFLKTFFKISSESICWKDLNGVFFQLKIGLYLFVTQSYLTVLIKRKASNTSGIRGKSMMASKLVNCLF